MGTTATMSRYSLLAAVAATGQEVCVAWVNGTDLQESIEALFGALSRLQQYDDQHTDDGPSEEAV